MSQGIPLRILNADPHGITRLFLSQPKTLLDLVERSLRSLNFFVTFLKAGNPPVDELVTEQLVSGER